MEQAQIEHRPLTLNELEGMLLRYADNAQVVKVIEDAMHRRLTDRVTGVM